MKKIFATVLTLSMLAGQAYAYQAPDVLINTRLDSDWSGILVSRIRKLMKNIGEPDPFRQKFTEPMTVSEGVVDEFLTPEARELLTDLGHMLEMDFLNGKTKVTLHGFRYEVNGFKNDVQATEDKAEGLSIASDFSASKVQVKADKVTLSLVMQGKNALPVISIDILKPVLSAYSDRLINFFARLQLKDQGGLYKLFLEQSDFSSLANGLVSSDDSIRMDVAGIVVPEVSVKIGKKVVKFDSKKIEALLLSKKEGVKGLLVAQVSSLLTGGLAGEKMKAINNVTFKKEHWIDTVDVQSMIRMESFQGNDRGTTLQATLKGDFCTIEKYKADKENCRNTKVTLPAKSRLNEKLHQDSLAQMDGLLDDGDANIVVSISEDYINKALMATYDAGLWTEILNKAGVMLGPNKVFIRLDDKGASTGNLYLDVLYTPKKLERMAVGTKEVRFPIAAKVGVKIKQERGTPIVAIFINEVDTSDDMLKNGRPEFGAISNIGKLRFKKKIIDTIRAELGSLTNQEVISLKFPKLRGLGLDKVDFVSDGSGRMNATLLLKDTSENASEYANTK